MRKNVGRALGLAVVQSLIPFAMPPVSAQQPAAPKSVTPTDRSVLPIPEPTYPYSTALDARGAPPPPRFEVRAPAGEQRWDA